MQREERERRVSLCMQRMRSIRTCDLLCDTTPAETHLLLAIVEHESETRKISELAELVGMQPAAVSRLMNSLEEKGLIERQSRAGNRRVTDVYPTLRGREINGQNQKAFHDFWAEVFENISAEDTERLIEIWDEVLDSMERVLERRAENQKEICP